MAIKHISLDAWNTILKPNPAFAEARMHFLAREFRCSLDLARSIYTETKHDIDASAEITGYSTPTAEMWKQLAMKFPNVSQSTFPPTVERLMFHAQQLFKQYPPIIPIETRTCISRLSQRGITFSVCSNTNFISGYVLGDFILEQIPEMSFMLFSDLSATLPDSTWASCIAKPNPEFYALVLKYAKYLHPVLHKNEILHIGDSTPCDFVGASRFGFDSKLINKPEDLAKAIEDAIPNNEQTDSQ